MKTKPLFIVIFTLALLTSAIVGGYALGRVSHVPQPVSNPNLPPLSDLSLPSQTQNGITASIESYYADASRLVFVIRMDGEKGPYFLDLLSIKDPGGEEINSAYSIDFVGDDPSLFYADFAPVVALEEEKLEGQLSFTVQSVTEGVSPTRFNFDVNIPIHPALTFRPKHSVRANEVEILLDTLIITPAYTQAFLCYNKPTEADWMVVEDVSLQVNGKSSGISDYSLLFDSDFGDIGKGGDPNWTLPVDSGRCVQIGFPIGDANPESVLLTIPTLQQSIPEVIPDEEIALAREKLLPQGIDIGWQVISSPSGGGGSGPVYNKIPLGMSEQEAYKKFIHALGYVYEGPWEFLVKIKP
ncbi:MAG: hypothetical protein MHPDNHAH_00226 [Anaerolineales bacterium]|nr:hypothetical protein [Anaerolineales bacterium]